MSGKKYTGPLPLPKPTAFERWKGARSVNKPTTTEDQDRITKRMAEKFKKSPKAQQYNKGGKVKKYSGNKFAKSILEESGKTISDADRARIQEMLGKQKTDRQMMQFEDGGAVRGMGKAYQGGKRSCKVR